MNKDDRIFLIVSFVVIILLLFLAVYLYMMKENEKDKRMSLQKQFDVLTVEKQNLEARLKDADVANVQATSNIKFQEEKIDMLSKGLEEEKAANNKNIAKIQEKEFEIQNLKAKVDEVRGEKLESLRTLSRLNEEYMNLIFQLENLVKTKEELEKKAKEVAEQEGVSLGTVIIKRPDK